MQEMRYRFGDFELDVGAAQLTGPNGPVALRPMTLKLLQCLVEAAPDVVTHEALLDQVWGRQEVTVGVVAQSVRELRKALGDPAQQPDYIETRHRIGYRLLAKVQRLPASASPVPPRPPAFGAGTLRWAAMVLVMITLVLAMVWPRQETDASAANEIALAYLPVALGQPGRALEPEARDWFDRGVEALRQRRLTDARRWLEQSLEREPTAPATLATLAALHAEHGEMGQARVLSAAALEASLTLPRLDRLRLEGLDAALHYRWEPAIEAYSAAFQLDRGDSGAGLSLFMAQIASGQAEAAERTLGALLDLPQARLSPASIELARARLAGLRATHPERLAAAQRAEQVATEPRTVAEAQMEQAGALIVLGRMDAANEVIDQLRLGLQDIDWPAGQYRLAMLEANMLRETSAFEDAIERYQSAAQLAARLGDPRGAAAALREAAYARVLSGDTSTAIADVEGMLAGLEARGDLRELASALNVLSVAEQRAGQLPESRESAERALALHLESGDRASEAGVRNNLGMLFGRVGRWPDAREQFELALEAFRLTGNRRGAAVALGNLAILYGREGRPEAAREANEAALADFRAVGSRLDVARMQFNLGIQDRRAGALLDAEARLREAVDGFESVGALDFRLASVASLAELLLVRGDPVAAAGLLDAVEGDALAGTPQRRAGLATAAGRLALARSNFDRAELEFGRALALRQEAGLDDWVRVSELDLAELAARRGEHVQAEQATRRLRRDFLQAEDGIEAARAGILLAVILSQTDSSAVTGLLQELESEVLGDALLALRLDLVRARLRDSGGETALRELTAQARAMGAEWLALQAELAIGGKEGEAAWAALADLGWSSAATGSDPAWF